MKAKIESLLLCSNLPCSVDIFVKDTDLHEAMSIAFAPEACVAACRACNNYGRLWTCPLFGSEIFSDYDSLKLVVSQIDVSNLATDSDVSGVFNKVKAIIHRTLLDEERCVGGITLSFAGSCDFCGEVQCSRIEGMPCRHPELARRSLEGVGFDVGRLLKHYFDITLQWAVEGTYPPVLTFVAAILHHKVNKT